MIPLLALISLHGILLYQLRILDDAGHRRFDVLNARHADSGILALQTLHAGVLFPCDGQYGASALEAIDDLGGE